MAAVVWAPTLAAVDAQLLLVSGSDLAIGQAIRRRLNDLGTAYDSVFTSAADTAKSDSASKAAALLSTWETEATDIHLDADAACRYVEDLYPQSPPLTNPAPSDVLSFVSANGEAIKTRIDRASRIASTNGNTAQVDILGIHKGRVKEKYRARPSGVVAVVPYDGPIVGHPAGLRAHEATYTSVRNLETALSTQVTAAASWVASASFT